MGIKEEMQTNKGLISLLREGILPDTKEMANRALKKVEDEKGVKVDKLYVQENFNSLLVELLKAETEIFEEIQLRVINEVLPFYTKKYFKRKEYPETNKLIQRLNIIYDRTKNNELDFDVFLESVTSELSPVIDIISFSAKQSAKTRVGNSLENHLRNLFSLLETSFDYQKKVGTEGAVLDFVIPSKKHFELDPSNVINLECQTTLKDRFRLTLAKISSVGAKKYLVTATGRNLITKSDKADLTLDKIREIIDENRVTLVVFDEVKVDIINRIQAEINKLRKNPNAKSALSMSKLERLLALSDRKICSFTELVDRDISNVLSFWGESI
jgi:hypothetical protein